MEQLTISISQILGISSGLALLISLAVSALWAIYFNRIKEGQKAEFQKQIESLKAKNEKLNYITKTQFDAEFKMYQEITEKMFNATLSFDVMILDDIQLQNSNAKEFFLKSSSDALSKINEFQKCIRKHAPFIDKKM